MLVETSSSGKITTSGKPIRLPHQPDLEMEAKAFTPLFQEARHQEGRLPLDQTMISAWALPRSSRKPRRRRSGDRGQGDDGPEGHDFSAPARQDQGICSDTLFVTTAVEQITLILKQAKDSSSTARIITTGGSNSPDQLIQQAGDAANGSLHLVFFTPWFTDAVKKPRRRQQVRRGVDEKKYPVGGLTEGFRGWDGIHVIVEAIKAAREARGRGHRQGALGRQGEGHQRDIAFIKQGPAGKESAQNTPACTWSRSDAGKVTKQ